MAVKGAAGIMPADARAAVRNNASRRVIGPVICLLKMRPLALQRDTTLRALRQAGAACECPAERERLAYEAQDKWLQLFGRNLEAEFEINGLALLVSTSCAMAMVLRWRGRAHGHGEAGAGSNQGSVPLEEIERGNGD